MSIQGQTEFYIGYKGNVVAYVNNKEKQYKVEISNNGTDYLTDTLAMAMSGNSIQRRLPAFIDLKYKTDSSEGYSSLLKSKIDISGRIFNAAQTINDVFKPSCVSLRAIITPNDKYGAGNDILSSTGNDLQMRLELYSLPPKYSVFDDEDYMLAYVCCKEEKKQDNALYQIYNAINHGTEAIIQWDMNFEIVDKNTNNESVEESTSTSETTDVSNTD